MRWRDAATVLAAAAAAAGAVASGAEPEPLRFGVVSLYSPRVMFLKYQPLVDYLTEHTGRPWKLVISTAYQETVDALCADDLTLAYLGPLTYVRARAACGATPVVRLETGGSAAYTSVILVRQDSSYRRVAELAGTRFGFGSALSTSSHLVPLAMLREAGISASGVDCRYFDHHERAARAVLLGEVEACGVRDLIGDRFSMRGLRVLARSAPIPNFPLVVGPDASPELRRLIVKVLVEDPRLRPELGRRMERWDEEFRSGFAPAVDADYEPVRELARRLFGPEALRLTPDRLRCGGEGD